MTADQASTETITNKWSRFYGSLYWFLGKAMLDRFGAEGEERLRQAVHDYGAYRASCIRADHQARGLALNLANLQNLGDMPNTDSLEKEGRICTPSYFRVTVTDCIHNETWRALGDIHVGRIYCAEVHHPLYCEYTEGVTLDLPDYLTKGDSFCTFVLTQPGAPEPAAQPVRDAHPEAKIARLYGVMYCFLARAMCDAFGKEGEKVLREALRAYAWHVSDSLGRDQLAYGWDRHASSLQPAGDPATPAGQAVYDAWVEVEGQGTPLGLIYFEEIHRPA